MSRLILVDKPVGPTSHDMISTLRKTLGIKKIGHCGTLDPMASGLLLVLTGKATRLAEIFGDHEKTYRGTVRFGNETTTDDREGEVTRQLENFTLDDNALADALIELKRRPTQVPPAFSAIKVGGIPMYKLARAGQLNVEDIPSRPVRIDHLELIAKRDNEVDLEMTCSAGTYVRALARDLGRLLEIPAHLSALRRLKSGPFHVDRAVDKDRLLWEDSTAPMGLSLEEGFAHLPAAVIQEGYLTRLGFGAQPEVGDLVGPEELPAVGDWVRMITAEGKLMALARVEEDPDPVLRLRRSVS
ncbi:MAG: tRNA pseudouridine(55) synthase TruB [bacterium]|nr:tRNA pseudouridine(55) synthase TruB [bacterium]